VSLRKLAGIEASRGIAALLVVLMHTASLFSDPKYFGEHAMGGLWTFGHAGVDFFFVLSGFIIYYVHSGDIDQPNRLQPYWRKRLIRIYPTYWAVLAVYGVLLYFSPSKDLYEQSIPVVITNILLIPQAHTPILSVAWSLSHEMLFYILFSMLFLSRTAGKVLFGIWLAGILLHVFGHYLPNTTVVRFLFNLFNLEFFFGIACAYLVKHKKSGPALPCFVLGMAFFFGTGLVESLLLGAQFDSIAFHLSYALSSALIIYGLTCLELAGCLRVDKLLLLLGQSSYSIYLVHVIVIMCFQQVYLHVLANLGLPQTFVFLTCVLITLACGIMFSRMVEMPLLRSRRRP